MELIRGIHNLQMKHRSCIVTIGAFDGLHLGHQKVIRHVLALAKQARLPSVVVTLEPLPREYFAPLDAPARLMSFSEKSAQLEKLGIDRVMMIPFNDKTRKMAAVEFVEKIFVQGLAAQHIVVGDDFRFGYAGEGDFALLKQIGQQHNFTVENMLTLEVENARVSSTRIRKLLQAGDFTQASTLLGRPYSISGKVIYGRQLGRELGAPTANVQLHRLKAAMSGVYAVLVTIADDAEPKALSGVANVGTRPTVDESIKAILEVHILDFDRNIYGKRISVQFCKKLRDEIKFESVDVLKAQIEQDKATANNYFTQLH